MDADAFEVVAKITGKKKKKKERTPVDIAEPTAAEEELDRLLGDFNAGSIFIKCNGEALWSDEIVNQALEKLKQTKEKKTEIAEGKSAKFTELQTAALQLCENHMSVEFLSTTDLGKLMSYIVQALSLSGMN
eukprot:4486853-Prymnesium_polylepis.1